VPAPARHDRTEEDANAIHAAPVFCAAGNSIDLQWGPPSPAGAQNAALVGDPNKKGLYVTMTKWPAGNHFSHPHFHPHDRFITVLSGTWWVGSGTKFDPDATVPMPAGTFVTHFGQQVHFDGAKTEDAVLLIVGEGPATATPAEVK
jgi:quercetin dioxygenase-like cupin family protein